MPPHRRVREAVQQAARLSTSSNGTDTLALVKKKTLATDGAVRPEAKETTRSPGLSGREEKKLTRRALRRALRNQRRNRGRRRRQQRRNGGKLTPEADPVVAPDHQKEEEPSGGATGAGHDDSKARTHRINVQEASEQVSA